MYGLSSATDYEQFYTTSMNEGITGIDAGQISSPGLNEFVVSTYSGKIVGFSDSQEFQKLGQEMTVSNAKDAEKKIKALKAAIEKTKNDIKTAKSQQSNSNVVVSDRMVW